MQFSNDQSPIRLIWFKPFCKVQVQNLVRFQTNESLRLNLDSVGSNKTKSTPPQNLCFSPLSSSYLRGNRKWEPQDELFTLLVTGSAAPAKLSIVSVLFFKGATASKNTVSHIQTIDPISIYDFKCLLGFTNFLV